MILCWNSPPIVEMVTHMVLIFKELCRRFGNNTNDSLALLWKCLPRFGSMCNLMINKLLTSLLLWRMMNWLVSICELSLCCVVTSNQIKEIIYQFYCWKLFHDDFSVIWMTWNDAQNVKCIYTSVLLKTNNNRDKDHLVLQKMYVYLWEINISKGNSDWYCF